MCDIRLGWLKQLQLKVRPVEQLHCLVGNPDVAVGYRAAAIARQLRMLCMSLNLAVTMCVPLQTFACLSS